MNRRLIYFITTAVLSLMAFALGLYIRFHCGMSVEETGETLLKVAPVVFVVAMTGAYIEAKGRGLIPTRRRDRGRVLSLLLDRVPGHVEGKVFQGRFKDRELRIEILEPAFEHARYLVELESPLGLLPVSQEPIEDVTTVERIAQEARDRAAEDPKLAALADSLLAGDNDWRALFLVFGVEDVSFVNGRVRATATFGEGFAAPDEAVRLERMLERLASVSAILGSILAVTKRPTKGRCPYCHDELTGPGPRWDCPKCGARHHQDCRDEHGRCAVFGCSEAEKVPERVG